MIDGKGCALIIGILVIGCFLIYTVINTVSGWF